MPCLEPYVNPLMASVKLNLKFPPLIVNALSTNNLSPISEILAVMLIVLIVVFANAAFKSVKFATFAIAWNAASAATAASKAVFMASAVMKDGDSIAICTEFLFVNCAYSVKFNPNRTAFLVMVTPIFATLASLISCTATAVLKAVCTWVTLVSVAAIKSSCTAVLFMDVNAL